MALEEVAISGTNSYALSASTLMCYWLIYAGMGDRREAPTFRESTRSKLLLPTCCKCSITWAYKAHFVGVSLGTIIIRQLAEMQPQRVSSMVLAGAIAKLDLRSRFFVGLGRAFKIWSLTSGCISYLLL